MSDRELVDLVFLPGFSTTDRVTHFSGRGVGMDVVRTNIEKIGGTVDIDSRVGRGTTVRMKIPLTLAIIPALTVTTGGDRYVIPQVSLVELVRLERQGEPGAVRGRLDRAHLPDDEAPELDVGAVLELAARAVRVEGHEGDGDERLLVARDGEADQGCDDHEKDDTVELGAEAYARQLRERAGGRVAHPAIRTLVVVPQMASDRKKSTMLIATIDVRTALPTATPTPAGPPDAV